MAYYVWHPQILSEIFECFIVSSVAEDCLVLSQYDLHHGSFLLVTPIVMSSCKSTCPVLAVKAPVLTVKAPVLTVKACPFGGVLYSVSFVHMQFKDHAVWHQYHQLAVTMLLFFQNH